MGGQQWADSSGQPHILLRQLFFSLNQPMHLAEGRNLVVHGSGDGRRIRTVVSYNASVSLSTAVSPVEEAGARL